MSFCRDVRSRNISILVILLVFSVARCAGETSAPDTLDQQLLQAVREKNAAAVLQLVGRGAHLDSRSADGATPLIIAVRGNNREMAKLLLDLGASTGTIDNDGKSALIYAAQASDKELVRIIVDKSGQNRTKSDTAATTPNENVTVTRKNSGIAVKRIRWLMCAMLVLIVLGTAWYIKRHNQAPQ